MTSNAPSSSTWRLYVILDRAAAGRRPLSEIAAAAIRGGADVLQLRDKHAAAPALILEARQILTLARAAQIPLIINDHPDVAKTVGADGVHLGQEDMPTAEARKLLGAGPLIGRSTHSLEQALAAKHSGADYLGFGPLFATPTKPAYGAIGLTQIRAARSASGLAQVCIGGIDQRTLPEVLQAGAQCVAVVRAVCAAADPESATRALKQMIVQFLRTEAARSV